MNKLINYNDSNQILFLELIFDLVNNKKRVGHNRFSGINLGRGSKKM